MCNTQWTSRVLNQKMEIKETQNGFCFKETMAFVVLGVIVETIEFEILVEKQTLC